METVLAESPQKNFSQNPALTARYVSERVLRSFQIMSCKLPQLMLNEGTTHYPHQVLHKVQVHGQNVCSFC